MKMQVIYLYAVLGLEWLVFLHDTRAKTLVELRREPAQLTQNSRSFLRCKLSRSRDMPIRHHQTMSSTEPRLRDKRGAKRTGANYPLLQHLFAAEGAVVSSCVHINICSRTLRPLLVESAPVWQLALG